MKRIVIPTIIFFLFCLTGFAQAPDKLSYQAVIRNPANALVTNTQVGVRISILQGSVFGASIYVEAQTPTTNANGLITLELGNGTVINGSMASINWANGPYFIKTETDPAGGSNYTITGTSQLLSVPYALYAKKTGFDGDSSSTNEIQILSKVGNNLILSNGGGTVTLPTSSGGTDGDTSASNELQTVSKTGNTVTLSNGGGSFTVDDADASPSNELQTVSKTGNTVTLSNGGGSFTVDDNDANPTNELQSISRSGYNLTLSNGGGTVALGDGDTSSSNELQTISRNGYNLTLSNGGGSITLGDGDTSSSNELQTVSQNGFTVTLSNGGGSFSIADGDTSLWKKSSSSSNIYYNQGNVGLGLASPLHRLHVNGTATASSISGVYNGSLMDFNGGNVNTNTYHGLRVNLTSGGDGVNVAIRGTALGATTNAAYGVMGRSDSSTLINRGVYGQTTSSGLYNQGVFGRSDGAGNGTTNSENMGLFGYATNNTTANYGVAGQADGASGINYGVWGYATGGSSNYAGYFNGNVTITGTFSNPSDIKLKRNIADLESPLTKLMALKVKTYEYISDKNLQLPKGKQFGFIAQDMETLFPELVNGQKQITPSVNGETPVITEYKAINYIGMIPVLTKAIQEQQLMIQQLQKRIAELELKK